MKVIVSLVFMLSVSSAFADNVYNVQNLMLLQPDAVLRARIQVEDFSNYITEVNVAAETTLAGIDKPTPTSGFIVCAVRPGGKSKVWLDFSPALPSKVAEQLQSSLEKVTPFKAKGGLVLFAIKVALWGAPPTDSKSPSPAEWQDVLKKADGRKEIRDIVEQVWPSEDEISVPEGFVLQPFSETGGSILRPNNWFYKSSGAPSGFSWTISKEDPANGSYETGMSIQLIIEVAKRTGKSAEQFAQGFLSSKRSSSKVLKDCPKEDIGKFYRQCLEVIETTPSATYRILYSVMWGKDADMVVVSIFGAPPGEWEAVKPIIDEMSHFTLFDDRNSDK